MPPVPVLGIPVVIEPPSIECNDRQCTIAQLTPEEEATVTTTAQVTSAAVIAVTVASVASAGAPMAIPLAFMLQRSVGDLGFRPRESGGGGIQPLWDADSGIWALGSRATEVGSKSFN